MATKRAIRLEGSDEMLEWPNGEIQHDVLERLLTDATEKKIEKSRLVIVIHNERVANFNPENPRYKNAIYRVPLKELYEMYKDINGEEFRPLTPEEEDIRLEAIGKRWRRGY